jgi:hypothetical protein
VKRSGSGEACRRGGQRVTGSEGVVDKEQGGPMELLEAIAWPKEVGGGRWTAGSHGGCRRWGEVVARSR